MSDKKRKKARKAKGDVVEEITTPPEPAAPDFDAQGRRLCAAKRTDGGKCRAPAMHAQRTCRLHGGTSPQARKAARERLAEEANPSIARLVHERDNAPASADRIRAANSLLDRAGLSRRQAIDFNMQPVASAREELLQRLLELRQAPPAVTANADEVIEAEIVDEEDDE